MLLQDSPLLIRRSLSLRSSIFTDNASDAAAESDADINNSASGDSGLGFIIITAVFRPVASVAHASK